MQPLLKVCQKKSVDETTIAIKEVARSAQRQAELSDELNTLIQKFKI